MNGINEYIFDILSNNIGCAEIIHACPQMPSSIPCISFYVNSSSPTAFADDGAYAENITVTLDIWHNSWEESGVLYGLANTALTEAGFIKSSGEDNVSFNQFNRRDAAVRKTVKFKIIF